MISPAINQVQRQTADAEIRVAIKVEYLYVVTKSKRSYDDFERNHHLLPTLNCKWPATGDQKSSFLRVN